MNTNTHTPTTAAPTQANNTSQSQNTMRLEHDCIGTKQVPDSVYWGIHTQRAIENFPVSGITDGEHPVMIQAFATIKRACALANHDLGLLTEQQAQAITTACQEIEQGKLLDQFPIDVLQGGAGTSLNMNMNEVIANRALEILNQPRGAYEYIHPNDDVNKSQSTNDTYPAASKLAIIRAIEPLIAECERLANAFHTLADKHIEDITIGRTQLQDAVPMTFGQEFHAFATMLKTDIAMLRAVIPHLCTLNLGATAIGTGICADLRFRKEATQQLARITQLPIRAASDPVAAVTDMSSYMHTADALQTLAIHLKKAADDLRLLNSGPASGFGELTVPARQAGSSIMPAKVNPVIPECVNQCCFMTFGMHTTVTWACSEGQLQLNAFDPVIVHVILQSIDMLTRAMSIFRTHCVEGITVHRDIGEQHAQMSPAIATALNPYIGYEQASAIAKQSAAQGRSVRNIAAESTNLSSQELDDILDPIALSRGLGQTCREHQES